MRKRKQPSEETERRSGRVDQGQQQQPLGGTVSGDGRDGLKMGLTVVGRAMDDDWDDGGEDGGAGEVLLAADGGIMNRGC
jgi:hypothetical protein